LKESGNRRELVGITRSTLLKKSGRIEGEWISKRISRNYNEHTVKEIRKELKKSGNRRELPELYTKQTVKNVCDWQSIYEVWNY
jgi:hypothetical protein